VGRANREAMHDLTAKRTLVKSPPELWSELSEVDRLATHLDAFGEITITKLEPEHTVAWEGEGASGTVSIEPSGWGTKVTLTAQLGGEAEVGAVEEPVAAAAVEEPAAAVEEETVDAPHAETAAVMEGVVEEPLEEAVEEPLEESVEGSVDEAVTDGPAVQEPAEPVQTSPRRKRGFLAWLFRPRTSRGVGDSEPVVAGSEPERTAPESVVPELEPDGTAPEPVAVLPEPVVALPEPVVEVRMGEEAEAEAEAEPDAPVEREPEAALDTEPEPEPHAEPEPDAVVEPEPDAAVASQPDAAGGQPKLDPRHVQAVLDEVLDTLGSAHHRPFSRG
jgi:hypothetical protein